MPLEKRNKQEKKRVLALDEYTLSQISKETLYRTSLNKDLLDLVPEVELGADIAVSSIISPVDLVSIELNYSSTCPYLSHTQKGTILNRLKEEVEDKYKITEELFTNVKEAYFFSGSYIELHMPLEYITNKLKQPKYTQESFVVSRANKDSIFESQDTSIENLHITSDIALLYAGRVNETLKTKNAINTLPYMKNTSYTQETFDVMGALNDIIGNKEKTSKEKVILFDSNETTTNGVIVRKLPLESVIPLHEPGDPSNILWYFILLDEHGSPVKGLKRKNVAATAMVTESGIESLKRAFGISVGLEEKLKSKNTTLKNMNEMVSELVRDKLSNIITDNSKIDLGSLPDSSIIYEELMHRILDKKQTRILCVPKDIVVNYTFEHGPTGLGISILDKIRPLLSMSAALVMAGVRASVENSIPYLKVNAKVPDNVDSQAYMKDVVKYASDIKGKSSPFNVVSLDTLNEWDTSIGLSFNFTGDTIPELDMSFDENNKSIDGPDDNVKNQINKHIAHSFSLTPDIIESGFTDELATVAIFNNAMIRRRFNYKRILLNSMLTKQLMVIYLTNKSIRDVIRDACEGVIKSEDFVLKDIEELKGLNEEEIINKMLNDVINGLNVKLPSVPSDNDEISDKLSTFSDDLEDVLDVIINDDSIPEGLYDSLRDNLDVVKTTIKATLVREWMTKNGYLPELMKMFDVQKDGKLKNTISESHIKYLAGLNESFEELIGKLKPNEDNEGTDE